MRLPTALLAAVTLLSALAHFRLPLPTSDPLRSTLAVLPLIAGVLLLLGEWSRRHGGRATPEAVKAGEIVLLALLVLLTLGRDHLGLGRWGTELDGLLVAGFALLLAHRLAWLTLSLRFCLGERLPARPPWPFFAVPFVVYVALLPWSSIQHRPDGDEPHYLLLTHSLAYDLDTDLANNYRQGDSLRFLERRLEPQLGDPVGRHGERYSRHNMLLPLVLAPAYRLAGTQGALVLMAALTAATAWLTLALAHHYVPELPAASLATWAVLAFASPLLLFSYQVWVEVPAALLVLAGLVFLHRLRSTASFAAWPGFALALAGLGLLKIRFLLIAAPLAALALWRGGRAARKQLALVLAGLVLFSLGVLAFNQTVFQNPLKYHDIDGLRPYVMPAASYFRGLAGLAFDTAFGLFSHAPLWLLLLPAAAVVIRRRRALLADTLVLFSPYLLMLAPRGEWFGAWSPPFRYGIVMMPLLALWLVPLLAQHLYFGRRLLISALTAATLALTLLWLVEPGWTYNLAHGRSHLLDLLADRLGTDVARLFPSSTRVRLATWIWPPVALLATSILWWMPGRRPRSASRWGVTCLLLALSALPIAARRYPTQVIEFEDPWVRKSGGETHPELWVIYRPRYRGGWILTDGQSVSAPIVKGGERLSLWIELRLLDTSGQPAELRLADGSGGTLAVHELGRSGEWQTISFADLPWSGDSALEITLVSSEGRPANSRVLLDRAVLSWGG